jgi:hypothetical protein
MGMQNVSMYDMGGRMTWACSVVMYSVAMNCMIMHGMDLPAVGMQIT